MASTEAAAGPGPSEHARSTVSPTVAAGHRGRAGVTVGGDMPTPEQVAPLNLQDRHDDLPGAAEARYHAASDIVTSTLGRRMLPVGPRT